MVKRWAQSDWRFSSYPFFWCFWAFYAIFFNRRSDWAHLFTIGLRILCTKYTQNCNLEIFTYNVNMASWLHGDIKSNFWPIKELDRIFQTCLLGWVTLTNPSPYFVLYFLCWMVWLQNGKLYTGYYKYCECLTKDDWGATVLRNANDYYTLQRNSMQCSCHLNSLKKKKRIQWHCKLVSATKTR